MYSDLKKHVEVYVVDTVPEEIFERLNSEGAFELYNSDLGYRQLVASFCDSIPDPPPYAVRKAFKRDGTWRVVRAHEYEQ